LDDGALPGVIFTGDAKNTLELDEYDPLGTWASKAWDILRVLDGYADAKLTGEFSQGVHAYLTQTRRAARATRQARMPPRNPTQWNSPPSSVNYECCRCRQR
jgi:hypothetical protein